MKDGVKIFHARTDYIIRVERRFGAIHTEVSLLMIHPKEQSKMIMERVVRATLIGEPIFAILGIATMCHKL